MNSSSMMLITDADDAAAGGVHSVHIEHSTSTFIHPFCIN